MIDWETGLSEALGRVAADHGIQADREVLLSHFAHVEHTIQAGPFRPYRQILEETLRGVGGRMGFEPSEAECRDFASSVAEWPPFPDSPAALAALGDAFKLGIVSNVDDDLFEGSRAQLGVSFEWVVTALQVESYKPALGHFTEMLQRSGVPKERVLHVAQSRYHDIGPARSLGPHDALGEPTRRAGRDRGDAGG